MKNLLRGVSPSARYAVLGDPIEHSLSPKMQNAALRACGLQGEYVPIRVPSGSCGEALSLLAGQGWIGANITVPLKTEALVWCQQSSVEAREIGAVNTVLFAERRGLNTDGPGFLRTLPDLTAPRALILGAGGAARAVAWALRQRGWPFFIWNRSPSRAEQLAEEFGGQMLPTPEVDVGDFNLVVNTTSAGLHGQALPVHWPTKGGGLALDISYGRELSPFLRSAAAFSWSVQDGRAMLLEQGALAFEAWTGLPAPREVMAREIEI